MRISPQRLCGRRIERKNERQTDRQTHQLSMTTIVIRAMSVYYTLLRLDNSTMRVGCSIQLLDRREGKVQKQQKK